MVTLADFESGDLTGWSGDTGDFDVTDDSGQVFAGDFSLRKPDGAISATITRTDVTVAPGETPFGATLRADETAIGQSPSFVLFGVQSATGLTSLDAYGLYITPNVEAGILRFDGGGANIIASTDTFAPSFGAWYTLRCTEWTTNGNITVEFRTNGVVQETVSVTDATYGAGGIGFGAFPSGRTLYDEYLKPPFGPDAPTNLTATIQQADVALSWTDQATDEDEYRVYRTRVATPTFPSDYTQLATLPADTESYTDADAPEDATLTYAVTAANADGESDPATVAVETLAVTKFVPIVGQIKRGVAAGGQATGETASGGATDGETAAGGQTDGETPAGGETEYPEE